MPRTILGAEHSSLSKIDKTPALKRLFFQQEASKTHKTISDGDKCSEGNEQRSGRDWLLEGLL